MFQLPAEILALIRNYLAFPPGPYTVLDPFLSTAAVLHLVAGTEATVYGVGMDAQHTEQMRSLLSIAADDGLIAGSCLLTGDGDPTKVRITESSMAVLLFNPPDDNRASDNILKHLARYVAPKGVLVAILRQDSLRDLARTITTHFHWISVLRLPDDYFYRFPVVVVMGLRKQPSRDKGQEDWLAAFATEDNIQPLEENAEPIYAVPSMQPNVPVFTTGAMAAEEAEALLNLGLLNTEIGALLNPPMKPRLESPPLPLSNGQIAQLLAIGALDGVIECREGPILIHGDVTKETITTIEVDGEHEVEREVENFKVSLHLLTQKGDYVRL